MKKLLKSEWTAIIITAITFLIMIGVYFSNLPAKSTYTVSGSHPARAVATPAPRRTFVLDEPINVNTAGFEELQVLPGIGETKALAILLYREKNGPFQTAEDLLNVKGIGPATLEKMKEYMTVSPP